MLKIIAHNAYQTHSDYRQWLVPRLIQLPVEVTRRQAVKVVNCSLLYSTVVIQEYISFRRFECCHLFRSVSPPNIRRVSLAVESDVPAIPDPELFLPNKVGNVVILYPSQMPGEPADAVGVPGRLLIHFIRGQAPERPLQYLHYASIAIGHQF